MLKRLNDRLEQALRALFALLFALLIVVVFAQVTARNVLEIPSIWTLDAAQLLFAWTIFLGAAVALRHGAHYRLELVPPGWARTNLALDGVAHLAAVVVVLVLLRHGLVFAEIGLRRTSPTLRLAGTWFFAPIPLGAAAMALFLIEAVLEDVQRARRLLT